MSIWNTLYTGSSGIKAYGEGLGVVGDNIANVSTTGYKGSRAQFEAMLGGTAMNGQREGNGVRMTGPQVLFGGGAISQSDMGTHMALDGSGFFAVRDPGTGLNSYTRDGNFRLDGNGYLVGSNGRVQGFSITGGQTAVQSGDLRVPPMVTGSTTTNIELNVQLDSSLPEPLNGTIDPTDPASYSYATNVEIVDSLGDSHQATVYFAQRGGGNWDYSVQVDGADVDQVAGTMFEIGTGTVEFNTSGQLVNQTGGVDASFARAEANQLVNFDFGNPISLGGDGSGSTQVDDRSTVLRINTDGVSAAALSDVGVNEDGALVARYANGQERAVAMIGVASFGENEGLARGPNQSFLATAASGDAILGTSASGNRGTVTGHALESSNVDLSDQLVTLIAYQRAFSSNARTVTTADEMLQEVTNLKR